MPAATSHRVIQAGAVDAEEPNMGVPGSVRTGTRRLTEKPHPAALRNTPLPILRPGKAIATVPPPEKPP